jgi:hypothetical protein
MDEKPHRVQLSRKKGWRMPENTVKVSRPGKWGNPWPIGEWGPLMRKAPDAAGAVGLFTQMMSDTQMRDSANYPADLNELRGKNLACWCKTGEPCHADVLLELANRATDAESESTPVTTPAK